MQQANRNAWQTVEAADVGDVIIAAMVAGGVDHVFFTSGSEIAFYQEAIAKARLSGQPAPRLITMTHEHASLNAALGYAALSGRPVVTAAHVDAGTQHYGGAVHTAMHANLPVVVTAGIPPTTPTGSSRGARNTGGQLWLQQTYDQHGIVRQYMKWDYRLQGYDNHGLIVSRALQVARSEPCGPVYLSIPLEVSTQNITGATFPTAEQLGLVTPPAPDPDGVRELVAALLRAENPFLIVSGSGRNPATVAPLVALCELIGLPVVNAAYRGYHCFPMDHALAVGSADLSSADVVVALDVDVPFIPGPKAPKPDAYTAMISLDPIRRKIPTYEFTANLRLTADPLRAIRALTDEARRVMTADDRNRAAARTRRWTELTRAGRVALEEDARRRATRTPIDPLYLGYEIGRLADDNCVIIDETLPPNRLIEYLHCNRPASFFATPGSSGGWGPGAALGAKLAAPDRDIVLCTGDGFYMFGTPAPAIWAAAHYKAPYLTVVYQNRSYTTGTIRTEGFYPDGYAKKADYDGGYFDPPIDFAKEAEAAGGYGENVRDPAELPAALRRGLERVRKGTPAVVSVWLPRLLKKD